VSRVESFPPLAKEDAALLILGSMPGPASLARNEYYGHPQNLFWKLLGEIFDFPATAPYPVRVEALMRRRIAVWDVLHSCTRPGALDSAIVMNTAVVSDVAGFLAAHPRITRIAFNGSTAEKIFRKRVLPTLGHPVQQVELVRLPSTSPANASVPVARKLEEWRSACEISTTFLSG
jgi:double-stranded uracil-DNA glycosylase